MANEISESEFETQCRALLDAVARERAEFVVTRQGRPVARLVSAEKALPIRGSVTFVERDDDLFTTREWRPLAAR